MINLGSILFIIELIIAENIILITYPKRKMFWLRFPISLVICVFLCGLFPSYVSTISPVVYSLIRFNSCFILSVVAMGFCYKINFIVLLSSCTAGYAIQHIGYHVGDLLKLTPIFVSYPTNRVFYRILVDLTTFLPVYLFFIFTLGIYIWKNKCYENYSMMITAISIVSILMIIGLSRINRIFGESNTVLSHLYAIISCCLVLFSQYIVIRYIRQVSETNIIRYLMEQKKEQYNISHDAIDLINIKYHVLKHRLNNMSVKLSKEEISEITDAMKITTAVIQTKNKTLDIILNNIGITCVKNNIQFNFSGEAQFLDVLTENEILSLFGNALENAIEAVKQVKEPNKRIITMTIEQKGDFLNVNILNYFVGKRKFKEGRLISTKPNSNNIHGFGTKSMEMIVKKYNGQINYYTFDDVFHLNMYLLK